MSGIFGTGVTGLVAAQRALATAGHNIANAHTEGYTRQRVELGSHSGQGSPHGFIGAGVGVQTVTRLVNEFLSTEIRVATAARDELALFDQLVRQVDSLLADPAGGLAPAMQSFFDAAHEVASDPTSIPARGVLIAQGQGLAQRFNVLHQRLEELRTDVGQGIPTLVSNVNALSAEVASLNGAILRAEAVANGQPANDLRDQRDETVRRLSSLVGVSVVVQDGNVMNVSLRSGQALVVGNSALGLSVIADQYDITRVQVGVAGGVGAVTGTGGELGALLDFRERVLDPAQNALGQVAIGLVRTFNQQHQMGQDLNGNLGAMFFNQLETTPGPGVLGHQQNTGVPQATFDVEIIDASALTASDYQLSRVGAAYTLTRLSDGAITTLSGFPGGIEQVDGLSIRLNAGAIADGDRFRIQPTRDAARLMDVEIVAASEVAVGSPVRAAASLANAGEAAISSVRVNAPSNAISFTFTSPTTIDVLDETTGAVLDSGVTYVPGGPLAYNGVTLDITGVPSAGDVFRSAHTVTSAAPGNTGSGSVSAAGLSFPDPNLADVVTITFDAPPGTFTVTGATTGTPTSAVPFVSGGAISFNGWITTITGTPQAGDVFTIEPNLGGVGDNRNMLRLQGIQTERTLEGETATFSDVNGQLIARVGTIAEQNDIGLATQEALLDQANRARSEVSGVNLDQEAADLLRFQQAYQANAQVIAIAAETFQALLRAVSR